MYEVCIMFNFEGFKFLNNLMNVIFSQGFHI